jgi:signal transduction histidine kinase
MFRTLSRPQLTVDLTIAGSLVLLRLLIATGYGLTLENLLMTVVILGMGVALALRRLSPGLALAVAWVTVAIQLGSNLDPDIANSAILAVLYTTGRYGNNLVRWFGFGSAFAGALVATIYETALIYGLDLGSSLPSAIVVFVVGFVLSASLFAISWTLGLLAKTYRISVDTRRAKEVAVAEQREAEQEVAVEQERTRIARDMHDVVAHSLAVVIAQADGARYAMKTDPDAADAALTTISATAREALGDVRVLLGQFRHDEGAAPQPVLADLDRLLDQMRASGLTIRREEAGEARTLATGQQLAVYRIVQESLTNALRHGERDVEVVVRFDWTAEALEVEVSSGLPLLPPGPDPDARPGHGLAGMRERAVLVGGSLRTGPRDGHWVVTATLPAAVVTA